MKRFFTLEYWIHDGRYVGKLKEAPGPDAEPDRWLMDMTLKAHCPYATMGLELR